MLPRLGLESSLPAFLALSLVRVTYRRATSEAAGN